MWFNNELHEFNTSENSQEHEIKLDINLTGFISLLRCAMLCNRAAFKTETENLNKPVILRECVGGNSDEVAILKACELEYGDVSGFRSRHKLLHMLPYNGRDKFQAFIHELPDEEETYLITLKGTPEQVIPRLISIKFFQLKNRSGNPNKSQSKRIEFGFITDRDKNYESRMEPDRFKNVSKLRYKK